MVAAHRVAHLIVGDIEGPTLTAMKSMAKLLDGLAIEGDYAIRREAAEVQCLFALKADADQLAEAVGAQEMERYPGWTSQRAFRLDRNTQGAIADVLEAAPVEADKPA